MLSVCFPKTYSALNFNFAWINGIAAYIKSHTHTYIRLYFSLFGTVFVWLDIRLIIFRRRFMSPIFLKCLRWRLWFLCVLVREFACGAIWSWTLFAERCSSFLLYRFYFTFTGQSVQIIFHLDSGLVDSVFLKTCSFFLGCGICWHMHTYIVYINIQGTMLWEVRIMTLNKHIFFEAIFVNSEYLSHDKCS